MINIGFFPAHPSQLWMMNSLSKSTPNNVKILWYVRDKDIMIELAEQLGLDYQVVSEAGTGYIKNALELFINIFKFLNYTRKDNIDIWFSKYGAVNIAAWLLRKKNFSFNDDDADIVPIIALTSYPFSKNVFCTNWTRMGRYEKYAIRYPSLHELFYLHPNHFTPNKELAYSFLKLTNAEPYVIIRLSSLQAHHDLTATGVSNKLLSRMIDMIEPKFKIFISSEKPLIKEFQKYQINIPTSKIHTVLANASFVIGDSLTMMTEAAVLGIPNLRISSFSGKIGTLNEMERRQLTQSVKPDDEDEIINRLEVLIRNDSDSIIKHRNLLLKETIDPIDFIWENIIKKAFKH